MRYVLLSPNRLHHSADVNALRRDRYSHCAEILENDAVARCACRFAPNQGEPRRAVQVGCDKARVVVGLQLDLGDVRRDVEGGTSWRAYRGLTVVRACLRQVD